MCQCLPTLIPTKGQQQEPRRSASTSFKVTSAATVTVPLQQYSTIEVKNKYVHCSGDGASQGLATLIPTNEQLQEEDMFVTCRKVFTEEEDDDEIG